MCIFFLLSYPKSVENLGSCTQGAVAHKRTPDSTSISKNITHNIRYEKKLVHILQTLELRSQLAKALGKGGGDGGTLHKR